MKNVTVSLDDETYRRARLRAAEMDKTLSAVVRDFLNGLGSGETVQERGRRELSALFERLDREGRGVDASNRPPRAALYDRDQARRDAAAARGG